MMAGDINANSAMLFFRASYMFWYHLSEMMRSMRGPSPFLQVPNQGGFCHSEEHYCSSTRNIHINFHRKFYRFSLVSGKKSE